MIETAPNWKVYHLILGLITVCRWGDTKCKYYKRLAEITAECIPVSEKTGVYEILGSDIRPTKKQAKKVAIIFAKKATELEWQPQKAMPKFSLFWIGLKQWF